MFLTSYQLNYCKLDIFACHGISGMVGLFLTGIFAQASVANNDAITEIPGGWLDGNFVQLGYQMAWICFATAWTGAGTFIIMFVIDHIPGLHFRAYDEGELAGLDDTECGEVSRLQQVTSPILKYMSQFCYDFAAHERDLEGNYVVPDATGSTTSGEKRDNGVSISEQDATTEIRPVNDNNSPQATEFGSAQEKETLAGQKEAAAPRMPQSDA